MNLFAAENLARFTRRQAALFHLGVSALVAAAIVAVMLLVWYPSPWFAAAGGRTLLILLVGVDVILGPLLTFIVFNPAKKSLVYDLAVIVMLQIAALIYGIHVMASARPAFVVYLRGGFDVVAANDVVTEGMGESKLPEFQSVPLNGTTSCGRAHSRRSGTAIEDRHGIGRGWRRFHGLSTFLYSVCHRLPRRCGARGAPVQTGAEKFRQRRVGRKSCQHVRQSNGKPGLPALAYSLR